MSSRSPLCATFLMFSCMMLTVLSISAWMAAVRALPAPPLLPPAEPGCCPAEPGWRPAEPGWEPEGEGTYGSYGLSCGQQERREHQLGLPCIVPDARQEKVPACTHSGEPDLDEAMRRNEHTSRVNVSRWTAVRTIFRAALLTCCSVCREAGGCWETEGRGWVHTRSCTSASRATQGISTAVSQVPGR